jgi:glutathione S-transferase
VTLKIYGNSLSPYVRKVLLVLEHKRIAYENDPVSPVMNPSAEFLRISPLRKIPVLRDGGFTLPDSSVICRYLEDVYPEPALYPRDVRARAFACWIEEYADTKLTECLAPIAGELIFKPRVLKQATDAENVAKLRAALPSAFDYLESIAPASGFVCGELSIADLALAAASLNARAANVGPELATHPRLHALMERVYAQPVVAARLARDRADYAPLFA